MEGAAKRGRAKAHMAPVNARIEPRITTWRNFKAENRNELNVFDDSRCPHAAIAATCRQPQPVRRHLACNRRYKKFILGETTA
jgi:hypothetical protein